MKRLRLMLVLILSFSLTGCIQKIDYTEEEGDAIAEYMAGRLLAHDKHYEQELILYDKLMEEKAAKDNANNTADSEKAEEVPGGDPKAEEQNSADVKGGSNLSNVIGGKYFNVKYKGCKLAAVYPDEEENPYFSLNARPEHRLLVVSFIVTNKTDQERGFKLSQDDVKYQLSIDGDTIYKPQFTLLENDLRYIDVKIGAGASTEALLVFEVPDQTDGSNIQLTVTNGKNTSTVAIK